jgi:hypothetical protein
MAEKGVVAMCMWNSPSTTKPPIQGRFRDIVQNDTHIRRIKIKPSAATLKQIVQFTRSKDGVVINLNSTTLANSSQFWDALGAEKATHGSKDMYIVFATSERRGVMAMARNSKWRNACFCTGMILSMILIGLIFVAIYMCCIPGNMYHKKMTEWEDVTTGAIQEGEDIV